MSAQVRMADALLRSVGGRTVLLQIPGMAVTGDAGEQLGLASLGLEAVELGPAVFRRVRAKIAATDKAKAAQYELLVSASAVAKVVGSLEYESAAVLFGAACGVLVDGEAMRIESFAKVEAFGVAYVYRLGLSGAAGDLV